MAARLTIMRVWLATKKRLRSGKEAIRLSPGASGGTKLARTIARPHQQRIIRMGLIRHLRQIQCQPTWPGKYASRNIKRPASPDVEQISHRWHDERHRIIRETFVKPPSVARYGQGAVNWI